MGRILTPQSEWDDLNTYADISQSDTLVSPAAHFWDMHETGSPSDLTDIVGGAIIDPGAGSLTPQSGGIYIRAKASSPGNSITNGIAIADRDFMLLSVAESVGTGDDNGHTGFYWEKLVSDVYVFKTHPYYALAGNVRTLPYQKNWVRTIGEIYTHALVKRGTTIEHYCLPRGFIDSFDMVANGIDGAPHYNLGAPNSTYLGHGGYGTPSNNGVGRVVGIPPWDNSGDVAQDYAGLAVYVFDNGAPGRETIVKCLRWSENEWTTKSSGKRLYPGFS